MSGKTKEEIAFDLVSKLKGVGVWGEQNMQQILDMYAECLEATSGLRAVKGGTPSALRLPGQGVAPATAKAAPAPAQAPAPRQAAPQQAAPAQQPPRRNNLQHLSNRKCGSNNKWCNRHFNNNRANSPASYIRSGASIASKSRPWVSCAKVACANARREALTASGTSSARMGHSA